MRAIDYLRRFRNYQKRFGIKAGDQEGDPVCRRPRGPALHGPVLSDRHPLGHGATAQRRRARRHHPGNERGLDAQPAAAEAGVVGDARFPQRPQRRAQHDSALRPSLRPPRRREHHLYLQWARPRIGRPGADGDLRGLRRRTAAEGRAATATKSRCGPTISPKATWPWPRSGTRPISSCSITARSPSST